MQQELWTTAVGKTTLVSTTKAHVGEGGRRRRMWRGQGAGARLVELAKLYSPKRLAMRR